MADRPNGGLFDPHYSPAKCRWWSTVMPSVRWDGEAYGHFDVLCEMLWGGRSAEETEALDWCFRRVTQEGAGHRVTGEWCVCLSETAPSVGEARGHIGGDGIGALIAVKRDLEHAADQLPISWGSTQAIFEAQGAGRTLLYRGRLLTYRQNLRVREIDRWLEPRDSDTGRPKSRSLAFWLMARSLGGVSDVCAWPKAGSIVQREVFSAEMARATATARLNESLGRMGLAYEMPEAA